jgi:hypothetical protein
MQRAALSLSRTDVIGSCDNGSYRRVACSSRAMRTDGSIRRDMAYYRIAARTVSAGRVRVSSEQF